MDVGTDLRGLGCKRNAQILGECARKYNHNCIKATVKSVEAGLPASVSALPGGSDTPALYAAFLRESVMLEGCRLLERILSREAIPAFILGPRREIELSMLNQTQQPSRNVTTCIKPACAFETAVPAHQAQKHSKHHLHQ